MTILPIFREMSVSNNNKKKEKKKKEITKAKMLQYVITNFSCEFLARK